MAGTVIPVLRRLQQGNCEFRAKAIQQSQPHVPPKVLHMVVHA